ncbi:MAG: 4Fe-4S dicluster domain-containing protein, partial [Bacteroidetes bacterium]|nr:4Fe-4S dicluster domain-containing protein [Bacteroidota bacterium]
MIDYCAELEKDIRFQEGMKSCLNCGVCSAICPAAEFYNYDPRLIVTLVQQRDNETIEKLLKSDTIWYCGQCMSCKTRCPRGNTAGM